MRRILVWPLLTVCAVVWLTVVWLEVAPVWAQSDILTGKPLTGLDGNPLGFQTEADRVGASGEFTLKPDGRTGQLRVTATIDPLWHIYSLTQRPGGPTPTKIKIDPSPDYRVGDFAPTSPPHKYISKDFGGLSVEEHSDEATWQAPLEIAEGVDPERLVITGAVYAMACERSCIPAKDYPFTARLAVGPKKRALPKGAQLGEYRQDSSHVVIRGELEPPTGPGDRLARLVLTAEPAPNWHVYALADHDPNQVSKPTLIVLTNTSGMKAQPPVAGAEPTSPQSQRDAPGTLPYHDEPVTWTIDFELPAKSSQSEFPISGLIGFQTCRAEQCDPPRAVRFTVTVPADPSSSEPIPLIFTDAKYGEAAKVAVEQMPVSLAALAWMVGVGLLGGMLLNLMPCVLPVIGLKILSFVDQSGQNRSRALALNLWYSAGLIAVFLVLATLAAGAKLGLTQEDLGWGQQFQNPVFNIVMSAVVFAMALSFLGVWEIPIPGFVGSGKATKLAAREGALGAFSKGVLTTVLATPCSGPFLGPVFGFTLNQPPGIIYVIFASIGLGMAAPYLLIGVFPSLIRFLPKPGTWMDTFKHFMGFVLLGTVVYLFTLLDPVYFVPTFALLIGLWAGCWWLGRTPLYEGGVKVLRAFVGGAAIATAVGVFAFTVLVPGKELLPWQPYSKAQLAQLTSSGKTVMVDFTANWCFNCKWNSRVAINTTDVEAVVLKNGVVPLLADWTHESDEIKSSINALGSNSIPLLAIFPADHPDQPIVLRDVVTKAQVVEALEKAGPSRDAEKAESTAMLREPR